MLRLKVCTCRGSRLTHRTAMRSPKKCKTSTEEPTKHEVSHKKTVTVVRPAKLAQETQRQLFFPFTGIRSVKVTRADVLPVFRVGNHALWAVIAIVFERQRRDPEYE
jgi:hypothetical protein